MDQGKRKRSGKPENLQKRANGVYYARATIDGREYRQSLKTRDEREAKRRLRTWLGQLSPYHGTQRHTFEEAALLWLRAGEWKPKTEAGYLKLLNVLLTHFEGRFWDQVDKPALQEFAEARRKAGAGTATINRYLTVVSGIAKHVAELPGWPEINPVTLLAKKPRRERRLPYVRPPATDIEAVLSRAKGTFGDLCRVALESGARKDELVFLEWDHAKNGRGTFYDTKSKIPRTVPWTPLAREIIDRQPRLKESPYVFNTRHGGAYKRVTEMWREYLNRAQKAAQKDGRRFTRLRFHDLRHEYAIRYLETGGSIYRLQKLLGHSTIKQTERYLDYLPPEQQEKAKSGTAQ